LTYLITLTVAYCSIVYELLMAQTLSALMGNTVLRYSVTIGVYLASLGVGAMLCKKGDEQNTTNRLIRIEIWLSIVGGLSVLLLCFFDVGHRFLGNNFEFFSQGFGASFRLTLFLIASHAIIVIIGILSGFEIPLLIALGEARKPNSMNKVLGVDYFGSLLGAVLFPLLLLPQLGLFAVAYITGLLNAAACGLLLIFKPATRKLRFAKMTGAIAIGLLLLLMFTPHTHRFFLEKLYYFKNDKSASVSESSRGRPGIKAVRQAGRRLQRRLKLPKDLSFVFNPRPPQAVGTNPKSIIHSDWTDNHS